jgi:hypothetical protein
VNKPLKINGGSNFAMLRDELLAEIETIAPVVREYASQSEQLGRLAEPIIKAVRQTSLLRFICGARAWRL